MGSGWDSVKKFSGIESGQKLAKGDLKGAVASNLGSGGIDESLQAVGLKKDKSKDEERRKAEAEATAKNQATGYDLQDKNESQSAQYFKDQAGRNTELMGSTKDAHGAMDRTSQDLELGQRSLLNEANDQATNAKKVYSNVSGKMDTLVNQSETDSKNAMSLSQYMDPSKSAAFNNVNNMYQSQAQNEGRQGLADVGVLGSLGAQSMGQGMAGMGPMTAGQQMGMLAQSQRQAGTAYASTQNRMQSLRDQGLQSGFKFHDKAYEAGLDAQSRHKGNLQDRVQLTNQDAALQSGFRSERSGFQGSIAGQQDARTGRGLGLAQQKYGLNSGLQKDKMGADAALRASRLGLSDKELGQNMGTILRADQTAASEVAANQKMAGQAASMVAAPFTGGASLAALGTMGGAAPAGGGGTPMTGTPGMGVTNNMGTENMLPPDPRLGNMKRNMSA